MMRTVIALLCLGLAGCETPTTFEAAHRPDAVGYSEVKLEPARYRVTFQGGDGAPATQVDNYVLLRAAQIAARDGYDWFVVLGSAGDAEPPHSSGAVSVGGGGFGGGFGGGGVGLGVGAAFPLSGGPRISRSLEISCGRDPRPPGAYAYDARALIAALAPLAASPSR